MKSSKSKNETGETPFNHVELDVAQLVQKRALCKVDKYNHQLIRAALVESINEEGYLLMFCMSENQPICRNIRFLNNLRNVSIGIDICIDF